MLMNRLWHSRCSAPRRPPPAPLRGNAWRQRIGRDHTTRNRVKWTSVYRAAVHTGKLTHRTPAERPFMLHKTSGRTAQQVNCETGLSVPMAGVVREQCRWTWIRPSQPWTRFWSQLWKGIGERPMEKTKRMSLETRPVWKQHRAK